jgi:hypothetical protein
MNPFLVDYIKLGQIDHQVLKSTMINIEQPGFNREFCGNLGLKWHVLEP